MTAGDFGEGVKGLTEIFAQKVAAQLHLQTVDHALDAVVGTYQSIVMAGVGYDDIVLSEGGDVGCLIDGLL